MVAHDEERRVGPSASRIESREQLRESVVLLDQGRRNVWPVWTVSVSHGVGAVPPREHKARPLLKGEIKPGQDLLHLRLLGDVTIEGRFAVGRANTAPVCLRTHPEKYGGAHALALGRDPDRLGFEPARIVFVLELSAHAIAE